MKQFVHKPIFGFAVTAFGYILMLLWGVSGITGNELGYSLLCFYVFAPILEFVCGFILGRKKTWLKWLYPLTASFNWLLAYLVFGRDGSPIFAEFLSLTYLTLVPAFAGLLFGVIFSKRKQK